MIERFADAYTNVLVIPNLFDLALFGAPTRYMGGVLGLEVHRQLLMRGPRMAKRAMDLLLTSILLATIMPLLVFLAILICIDSRGSAFYRQMRVGQDGVRFMALKFRTMHGDGEKRLAEVLARDPELRAEYEQFHKLAVDEEFIDRSPLAGESHYYIRLRQTDQEMAWGSPIWLKRP